MRETVLCRLYLRAVVPALCDLAALVPEARRMIEGLEFDLKFSRWKGPSVILAFQKGVITLLDGDGSAKNPLALLFPSDRQVYRFFSKKGFSLPLITGGLCHLGKLGTVRKLLLLLEDHLHPPPEKLRETSFCRTHLCMIFPLVLRALREIVEHDPMSAGLLAETPPGMAEFRVGRGGFRGWIELDVNRRAARIGQGNAPRPPDVVITFRDEMVALGVLQNAVDSMVAVGLGDITVEGLVPLADGLSLVMDRISFYLGHP